MYGWRGSPRRLGLRRGHAHPPARPPATPAALLRPRPTLLSCGGRRRRTRVVRRRTSLRSASDIDPASDRSSLSRRDGRHTLRPAGLATRCASDDASSPATARLWPRGASSPASTNAVDAQPACIDDCHVLASCPAPPPTRCATPSTARRLKVTKTSLRLPLAWRCRGRRQRHFPSRCRTVGGREGSSILPLGSPTPRFVALSTVITSLRGGAT